MGKNAARGEAWAVSTNWFSTQDGKSCNQVSHGNRIRESGATTIQYLGVQLNNLWRLYFITSLFSRAHSTLGSVFEKLVPFPGWGNLGVRGPMAGETCECATLGDVLKTLQNN